MLLMLVSGRPPVFVINEQLLYYDYDYNIQSILMETGFVICISNGQLYLTNYNYIIICINDPYAIQTQ